MMEPRALNIAIFLDEVTEFNGPLLLIPQSHHDGALDIATDTDVPEDYAKHGKWITTLTAKLKHTLSKESLKELVTKYGIVAPKGSSGSVLFFHPSVVHGSVPNLSPFDRTLLVISYNSVENPLKDVSEPRPEFLASRDFTPLEAIPDEALQST
jgi:ectoine hydroxylase